MSPSTLTTCPHTYEPEYFPFLFAIEDNHFWFRARNQVIATLMSQIVARLAPGYRVLEIGCGTGNTLRVLARSCSQGIVIGLDLFAEGLYYARQRTSNPLVQGDMDAPPFSTNFDVICLFDTLEHIPADTTALSRLRRLLLRGGGLFLTVPAYPSLWSYFDQVSRHCRRYQANELASKLVCAGFRVEYLTYYMASLFPVVWLRRRLGASFHKSPQDGLEFAHHLASREFKIGNHTNNLLMRIVSWEIPWIARRRHLPFGTSLLAIARKDAD